MATADLGTTRFAALTRPQAAAVVALWFIVTAWLVAGASRDVSSPSNGPSSASGEQSDVALYRAIVARVRAGQDYYDAAAAELRGRHYPMRPAFTWRQPTYAWFLSRVPHPLVASGVLVLISVAVAFLTARWIRGTPLRQHWFVAVALMAVSMSGCFVRDYIFLQEAWAGSFIALAIVLSSNGFRRTAVAASFAALAFRELALLPCVVGVLFSLRRRYWAEVAAWLVGLAIYGALMAWHVAVVTRHLLPNDLSRGWLAVGGSSFILTTCQWSGVLVFLPKWAIALILPLILLGLAGWTDVGAERVALVVVGYLVVFAFVGNSFNDYWGAMFAPLLSFGLLMAPASLRELASAATGRDLRARRIG